MSVSGAFILPHPPIILPEVGKGQEKKIQKTINSCKEIALRVAALKPDTIVLTSPHSVIFEDYFHISPGKNFNADLRKFGAVSVKINTRYDNEFVEELEKNAELSGVPAGTKVPLGIWGERDSSFDHGAIIPLTFINEQYTNYKLIHIGLSGLPFTDHYRLGMCIGKTADKLNRNVVFIASGDLSHKVSEDGPYGFSSEGLEFDKEITAAMADGNFMRFLTFEPGFIEKAAECGLRSFIIMAGALDGKKVKSELLSYEGTFGVGYGCAAFIPESEDESRKLFDIYINKEKDRLKDIKNNEDEYVRLARYSIESFLTDNKKAAIPGNLPREMLTKKAGVFVSLKKQGNLRGCIGTIAPVTDSIAEEIMRNAISAAVEDPRFEPVKLEEADELVYSVDVLSSAEQIASAEELDVKRYGVIVTSGYKRGLLLPNLEGVDTIDRQIAIALQKAGIKSNENYSLERFEVIRHK